MKIAKTAPEALRILWEGKIFLKPKDVKSIKQVLERKGYNFPDKALLMALKRATFLTKRGNRGNYTYVQKYPYVEEGKNGKWKRTK